MERTKSVLIVLLLLLALVIYGQNGGNILTGFVLNQDMEPVAGALVQVGSYNKDFNVEFSGMTDEYGHYLISVDETSDSRMAVVSAEGYPKILYNEQSFDFSQGSQTQNYYLCNTAVFHTGQLASIFLPTVPDATLGNYYRLDRIEDKHLMFERELNPKADIPYLIIPNKEFRIKYAGTEAEGKWVEQSFTEASFYGFYTPTTYGRFEQEMTLIIDKTPDCSYIYGGKSSWEYGARIGGYRALFTLKSAGNWTNVDPMTHAINDDWRNLLIFHDGTTDITFTYEDLAVANAQPLRPAFAGIVADQDKHPIAKAQVRLRDTDGRFAYEAETDDYGHFLLPIDEIGKPYEVSVLAENYPEQWQYRNGWQPFDFSKGSFSDVFTLSNKAIFKANQRASIILSTTPDPTLGRFYRLEKVDKGKIVFCYEPLPKANVPYIIVPSKDFEIHYLSAELVESEGEVSAQGVKMKGFYSKQGYKRGKDEYTVLLDQTPDCAYIFEGEHSNTDVGCTVGAMRSVLIIDSSEFKDLHKNVSSHTPSLYDRWIVAASIVFLDEEDTGITVIGEASEYFAPTYDLQGRRLTAEPQRGLYIRDGKKYVVKE